MKKVAFIGLDESRIGRLTMILKNYHDEIITDREHADFLIYIDTPYNICLRDNPTLEDSEMLRQEYQKTESIAKYDKRARVFMYQFEDNTIQGILRLTGGGCDGI